MAERRHLLCYRVIAMVDLTASGDFWRLAPPGGYQDSSSGPHFLQLRCLVCGDGMDKDAVLYALPRGGQGCSESVGVHMVRKCRGCYRLGSVELVQEAGCLTVKAGRIHFLTVKAQGYQVLGYTAGSGWQATSCAGKVATLSYQTERKIFKGTDAAGEKIEVHTVFDVVRHKD